MSLDPNAWRSIKPLSETNVAEEPSFIPISRRQQQMSRRRKAKLRLSNRHHNQRIHRTKTQRHRSLYSSEYNTKCGAKLTPASEENPPISSEDLDPNEQLVHRRHNINVRGRRCSHMASLARFLDNNARIFSRSKEKYIFFGSLPFSGIPFHLNLEHPFQASGAASWKTTPVIVLLYTDGPFVQHAAF